MGAGGGLCGTGVCVGWDGGRGPPRPRPLGPLSTPPPGCGRTSPHGGSAAPGEPSEPWPGRELGSSGAQGCRGCSEGQSREPRGAGTAEGRVPEPSEAPGVAASAVTSLGWQVQAGKTKSAVSGGPRAAVRVDPPQTGGGGGCGGLSVWGANPAGEPQAPGQEPALLKRSPPPGRRLSPPVLAPSDLALGL